MASLQIEAIMSVAAYNYYCFFGASDLIAVSHLSEADSSQNDFNFTCKLVVFSCTTDL